MWYNPVSSCTCNTIVTFLSCQHSCWFRYCNTYRAAVSAVTGSVWSCLSGGVCSSLSIQIPLLIYLSGRGFSGCRYSVELSEYNWGVECTYPISRVPHSVFIQPIGRIMLRCRYGLFMWGVQFVLAVFHTSPGILSGSSSQKLCSTQVPGLFPGIQFIRVQVVSPELSASGFWIVRPVLPDLLYQPQIRLVYVREL